MWATSHNWKGESGWSLMSLMGIRSANLPPNQCMLKEYKNKILLWHYYGYVDVGLKVEEGHLQRWSIRNILGKRCKGLECKG